MARYGIWCFLKNIILIESKLYLIVLCQHYTILSTFFLYCFNTDVLLQVKLLIATSVAARGLDVKHLILVVNYDCPNHYEDYVHRCGRTGRAGNKGFAYTFITPEQSRYAGDILKAFELASIPVPDQLRNLWETYKTKQEAEGK